MSRNRAFYFHFVNAEVWRAPYHDGAYHHHLHSKHKDLFMPAIHICTYHSWLRKSVSSAQSVEKKDRPRFEGILPAGIINILFVLMLTLLVVSCTKGHRDMITILSDDGSCTRELTLHLDSAQLVSGKITDSMNVARIAQGYELSWTLDSDTMRHGFPMSRKTYDSLAQTDRRAMVEERVQGTRTCPL